MNSFLLAIIFWGLYPILFKVAVNPQYMNTPLSVSMIGFTLGVVLITAIFNVPKVKIDSNLEFNRMGFYLSIGAGILWCLGQTAVTNALTNPGTDISKLVVLYNVNTLVTVLGGIILLKELPEPGSYLKILIAAILVILGGIISSEN